MVVEPAPDAAQRGNVLLAHPAALAAVLDELHLQSVGPGQCRVDPAEPDTPATARLNRALFGAAPTDAVSPRNRAAATTTGDLGRDTTRLKSITGELAVTNEHVVVFKLARHYLQATTLLTEPPPSTMDLPVDDEQAARLVAALDSIIGYDRYSLSPRITALREIRALGVVPPASAAPPQRL